MAHYDGQECWHGDRCVKFGCGFVHSVGRPKDCSKGAACEEPKCKKIHPQECWHGKRCVKFGCSKSHPDGRLKECSEGAACGKKGCQLLHPRTKAPTTSADTKTAAAETTLRSRTTYATITSDAPKTLDEFVDKVIDEATVMKTLYEKCKKTFSLQNGDGDGDDDDDDDDDDRMIEQIVLFTRKKVLKNIRSTLNKALSRVNEELEKDPAQTLSTPHPEDGGGTADTKP